MLIKQISVFIENKPGSMSDVIKILGENDIDIYALTIADTTDFGILRMIVNDPEKTSQVLKSKGMIVKNTNVIAINVEDKPGGLTHILTTLKDKGIDIEYIYAFIGKNENGATVVIKVADPKEVIEILSATDVELVDAKSLYR